MPSYSLTVDGATYDVDAPDEQAALTALNAMLGRAPAPQAPGPASWDQEMMTHMPPMRTEAEIVREKAAEQLGVPISEVDLSKGNLGPIDRARYGYMTDVLPEEMAYLQKQYPEAEIVNANGTLVVKTADGQILTPNPPGFEALGSPAQFLGRTGPGIVAGTAGAAAGAAGGPVASAAAAAGSVGAVEAARELVQRAYGTAEESFQDVAKRVALDMALEGIPLTGKSLKAAGAKIFGRGQTEAVRFLDQVSTEELDAFIRWAQENEISVPNLLRLQQSDNVVLKRVADQALQFSGKARQRLVAQMDQFANGIRDAGPTVAAGRSADDILQEQAALNYEDRFRRYAGEPVSTEAEGQNLADLVETTRTTRKKSMGEGYDKVRELTDRWKPTYNMSSAQAAARRRQINGDLAMPRVADGELQRPPKGEPGLVPEGQTFDYETLGPVEVREYMGKIRVNPDPAGKLAQINDLMARLDPRQDYATVQDLRSQVGSLLEMSRARLLEGGVDIGQAKRIYGELKDALEDPQQVIPGAREGIVRATREANRRAVEYYDLYDQPAVQRALEAPRSGEMPSLFLSVADSPKTLNEKFRRVLDEGTEEQQAQFRSALERRLLQNGDPVANLAQFQTDNLDAYRWMFPDKAAQKTAADNARVLRDLNQGLSKKAEDAAFEQVGFSMKAIQEHMKKRTVRGSSGADQARDLVNQYGGRGSEGHRALRQAVWADVMTGGAGESKRGALEFHEATENLVMNPKVLRNKIAYLKESGLWDGVLTERDRRVLDGALKYAQTTYRKGDAGTGLTVAAQVGQARRGDVGAMGAIYSGYKMADFLTRDAIEPSLLFQRLGGKANRRGAWLGDPAVKRTLGAVARGYGQGVAAEGVREGSQSRATSAPGQPGLPPELLATPPG
jgi:hypothetical protein